MKLYPVSAGSIDPSDEKRISEIRRILKMRRADRYTVLNAGAAAEAVMRAFGTLHVPEETGIVLTGAFGPRSTTESFLNDLLDYTEEEVIPTRFTYSVYNAAASCLSMTFGAKGPSYTLTGFNDLFYEGLMECSLLLESGECPYVLLLAAEEMTLDSKWIQKICQVPPESAYAFIFGKQPGKYPAISDIEPYRSTVSANMAEKLFQTF